LDEPVMDQGSLASVGTHGNCPFFAVDRNRMPWRPHGRQIAGRQFPKGNRMNIVWKFSLVFFTFSLDLGRLMGVYRCSLATLLLLFLEKSESSAYHEKRFDFCSNCS